VTIDVYKKVRAVASERELVLVGQATTAVLVGLGLLWIPLMRLISGQLYQYLQSVQAYISPPIAAVFLIGIMWRRVNATGAMAALLAGFVLGMGRLVAEIGKQGLSGALRTYADINFLHFAVLLFVVCSVILVVVSLMTAPPPAEKVEGLTLAARKRVTEDDRSRRWRGRDTLLSLGLAASVAAIWIYFS